MARGGKREGAGRKAGTPNSASAAREAEVRASGLTPLDYMLTTLRNEDADTKDRMWAAEKAAPYVHPKLANVEVEHGGSIEIKTEVEPRQIARAVLALLSEAEIEEEQP